MAIILVYKYAKFYQMKMFLLGVFFFLLNENVNDYGFFLIVLKVFVIINVLSKPGKFKQTYLLSMM